MVRSTIGGGWICCKCELYDRLYWQKRIKQRRQLRAIYKPPPNPDQLDHDEYVLEMSIGGMTYDPLKE